MASGGDPPPSSLDVDAVIDSAASALDLSNRVETYSSEHTDLQNTEGSADTNSTEAEDLTVYREKLSGIPGSSSGTEKLVTSTSESTSAPVATSKTFPAQTPAPSPAFTPKANRFQMLQTSDSAIRQKETDHGELHQGRMKMVKLEVEEMEFVNKLRRQKYTYACKTAEGEQKDRLEEVEARSRHVDALHALELEEIRSQMEHNEALTALKKEHRAAVGVLEMEHQAAVRTLELEVLRRQSDR